MSGQIQYVTNNSLLVVNPHGKLRRLFVPFAVRSHAKVGVILTGSTVYVEEVAEHRIYRIIYRVFNE